MTNDDKPEIEGLEEAIATSNITKSYASFGLLTAQEAQIGGQATESLYEKNPYMPMIVLDGKLTPVEAHVARQRMGTWDCVVETFGVEGNLGSILLQDLELDQNVRTYGQTVKDPELLNAQYFADMPDKEEILKEFPYARPQEEQS